MKETTDIKTNTKSLGKEQGKSILVIDNYDSFTYNLVHYLEDLDSHVRAFKKYF